MTAPDRATAASRGYLDGGAGPELLDALDRTDLLWFVQRPGVVLRTRRAMPAEADYLAASSGHRPRRVTVRRLAAGMLSRDYGPAGAVLAFVAPAIVRDVFR